MNRVDLMSAARSGQQQMFYRDKKAVGITDSMNGTSQAQGKIHQDRIPHGRTGRTGMGEGATAASSLAGASRSLHRFPGGASGGAPGTAFAARRQVQYRQN